MHCDGAISYLNESVVFGQPHSSLHYYVTVTINVHSVSVSQFPPEKGEGQRGVPLVETWVEEVALCPVEPGEEGVDGDGRQHRPPLLLAQVLGTESAI